MDPPFDQLRVKLLSQYTDALQALPKKLSVEVIQLLLRDLTPPSNNVEHALLYDLQDELKNRFSKSKCIR